MDDIQRKLELIDRQLAGGTLANFHKQIVSTAPLLFVAVGLIAGILIQNTFDLPVWVWLAAVGVCAAATIISYIVSRISHLIKEKNLPFISAYMALVCFTCLGAMRLISYEQPGSNNIRNFVGGEQKLATIRGLIVTEPYINKNRDWEFAKFKFTDPASSFYLKVKEVETVDGWAKASGTVRVQVAEPVLDLKAGDHIQAYCWLDRFKEPTNPGQFDVSQYLARKNIFIAASIKSRDGIELLKNRPAGFFTKIKSRFKDKATQALLGGPFPEDQSEGLLQALLLGYRRDIDSATYEAFRKTGLLHFISLSGLHVGILVLIIWRLCQTAGLMKPARAIVCIIAICIFLLIVPPRAPILRASIICFVFCISFFFRRKSNPLNTLSLAAIILLLIGPTALFNRGWQLSFSTVLGILFFTSWIENFLHERTGEWFWNIASEDSKILKRSTKRLGRAAITLFSVGLAAWLGGAGIALYHFHMITPLTAVWTVVVFPLVGLILTVGYLKMTLALLLPTAAAVLGSVVNGLSDSLIWIVKLIASWDISAILIGYVSPTSIIFYYGSVLFASFVYFWRPLMKRPLLKKAIYMVMVLVMIVFLGVTKWQRTNHENLVMTCLDVGHGQAILAQLPGRGNILFDAGSLHKNDVGRRIVAAFLGYRGINRIDSIIISHNDVDHINGIPEIAECCKVGSVYANDAFFSRTDRWGTAKFLEESLSKKGLEIKRLSEKSNLGSSADIKILWPSEQICVVDELSDNDKSVVCLIEFAGTEILLCSDIEKFAQRELLRLYPTLKADIVVVPHHGLVKTLEADFLENLEPGILICSCGRIDYERQRTTRAENKAKSFYTARDGAIGVCIKKDGTIISKCVNEWMCK